VVWFGINAVDYYPALNPTNYLGLDFSAGNQYGFFNEITNAEDYWNIFAPRISVTMYLEKSNFIRHCVFSKQNYKNWR